MQVDLGIIYHDIVIKSNSKLLINIGKTNSRTKLFSYLFSESIKYENKAIVELTDLDIQAIKRYADADKDKGSVIDNLVKLFDPSII